MDIIAYKTIGVAQIHNVHVKIRRDNKRGDDFHGSDRVPFQLQLHWGCVMLPVAGLDRKCAKSSGVTVFYTISLNGHPI